MLKGTSLALAAFVAHGIAAGSAEAAGEIGDVVDVLTGAYGQPPTLEKRELFPAVEIYADEVVETVPAGGLTVQFLDGTSLTLGGDSQVVLDEFVYNPAAAGGAVELGKGIFRFIGGKSGHRDGTHVLTPTAAIGIRGTDFVVVVDDTGTRVGVVSGLVTASHLDGSGAVDLLPGSYADIPAGGGPLTVGIAPAALGDPFALALWYGGGDLFVALAGVEPAAGSPPPPQQTALPTITECPNGAYGCGGERPSQLNGDRTEPATFQPASAPTGPTPPSGGDEGDGGDGGEGEGDGGEGEGGGGEGEGGGGEGEGGGGEGEGGGGEGEGGGGEGEGGGGEGEGGGGEGEGGGGEGEGGGGEGGGGYGDGGYCGDDGDDDDDDGGDI